MLGWIRWTALAFALAQGGRIARAQSGDALFARPSAPRDTPAKETGFLTLTSTPEATVSVDGKEVGTTPIVKLELATGAHQITLVAAAGQLKRTLGVTIVKGETKVLKVNL
jgi:eukaryotic-like serine/threonine-protein kinase